MESWVRLTWTLGESRRMNSILFFILILPFELTISARTCSASEATCLRAFSECRKDSSKVLFSAGVKTADFCRRRIFALSSWPETCSTVCKTDLACSSTAQISKIFSAILTVDVKAAPIAPSVAGSMMRRSVVRVPPFAQCSCIKDIHGMHLLGTVVCGTWVQNKTVVSIG